MLTGKVYRSIGVVLAFGGILYLFMATRINNGADVSDVVLFQPVPTDLSGEKPVSYKSHHLHLTSKNDASLIKPGVKNVDINNTSSFVDIQQNHSNNNLYNITIKDKTSVINVHKVIKMTRTEPNVTAAISPSLSHSSVDSNHIDKIPTVLSDKKVIIIIAYMRTGSTLTASLLQEHPNTFYVFEPIRSVNTKFKEAKKKNLTSTLLHYVHGIERNYTFSKKSQVMLDEINSWLTCKLDSISKESLGDDFHRHYTKIMKLFYYCSHGVMASLSTSKKLAMHSRLHPRLRQYYEKTKSMDSCLRRAIDSCQKSTTRLLKLIRLRMKEIEKILPLYPNMKVIHLVRDPRGIINSRVKVHALKPSIYEENINELCDALKEDLKYSKRILQHYPDRLKVVHYEDMAEHPMETAKSLIDFAGLQFTKHMQDFLLKQTHSARDSCPYCTQRRDSNATAHKWRTQLDLKNASYIYDKCRYSSGVLGYLPLSTVSSLRNIEIASRQPFDVNKLLLNENF
ncbi:carbohydrate sulfotransferase 1-like isoform X2 [Ruditapes philippinarum]|nr:carbohydrate sulfotransferase 1-like isoform X2 [Ruditapes philippinarum]XP_060566736.1 carbohydrate sulfotransferase 1-like isoform X2 [Ruditapes philippinarum]